MKHPNIWQGVENKNMQTNAVALHSMQYETKYVLTFIKNTLVNIIYTQERRG